MRTEYDFAKEICEQIQQQGYNAYLVGGCVRDILLERPVKDYDICSNIPSALLKKQFKTFDGGGEKYGVTHVFGGEYIFEIATFRSDGNYTDGRRPDNVTFCDPQQDASRRDFTINGLFYDPVRNDWFDYVEGIRDIKLRILKCIGNPKDRFSEDYLRMLRYIRFLSQIPELKEDHKTSLAIYELADKIQTISKERIRDELLKILQSPDPVRGMELLLKFGFMKYILQDVQLFVGCAQPPKHHPEGDVWTHTMLMLKNIDKNNSDLSPVFSIAVLLHDIGKPRTASNNAGKIQFLGHEFIGSKIADSICRKELMLPNSDTERICWLIENHMLMHNIRKLKIHNRKKLLLHPYFPELMELSRLDEISTGRQYEDLTEWITEQHQKVNENPINKKCLLNGEDLIILGFEPGPLFGQILSDLMDNQLKELIQTKIAAKEYIKTKWSDQYV